jgi:hypothetical protein
MKRFSEAAVECDDKDIVVTLSDGQVLRVPHSVVPRILAASPEQRL